MKDKTVTNEEMWLFMTDEATTELRQRIAAQLDDKASFASKWLENYRNPPERPEDVDPDWLTSDEQSTAATVKPSRLMRAAFIGVVTFAAVAALALIAGWSRLANVECSLESTVAANAKLIQKTRDLNILNAELERVMSYMTQAELEKAERIYRPSLGDITGNLARIRPSGTVKVAVQNVTFPTWVIWQVNGTESKRLVYSGENVEMDLPAADVVKIFGRPRHTKMWFQPMRVVLERNGEAKRLGTSLGQVAMTVQDGDKVTLHLEQPFAPWNAVFIRIKGEWAMVTLERPRADFRIEELKDANQKELPNTPLCWAREGSEGMARELTKFFLENRHDNALDGRYRGKTHTSIIVPATADGVSKTFREITEEEMRKALVGAFELLRTHQAPVGPTVAEEIEAAAAMLKKL